MDQSFELLSTMSPMINNKCKPMKRAPTKLALKKYFRKSLVVPTQIVKNETIISVSSESCSSELSDSVISASLGSPIVISDSENSINSPAQELPNKMSPLLNKKGNSLVQKYLNIQSWVDNVNNAEKDVSMFTELSAVVGDANHNLKKPQTNQAASSTLISESVKRFDELFKPKELQYDSLNEKNKWKEENVSIIASLISEKENIENRLIVEDSFLSSYMTAKDKLDLDSSGEDLENQKDFEKKSERNKKETVNRKLSFSSQLQKKNPFQSPMLQRLKSLCDSDTESEKSPDSIDDKNNQEVDNSPKLDECEKLLDSLYGDSWREKKDEILPSSEPRIRTNIAKSFKKTVPNTEKPIKTVSHIDRSNNLLKSLQQNRFNKALGSPLPTYKNVCDSDSESEDDKVLPKLKLNFDDDKDNEISSIKSKTKKVANAQNKSATKCYSFLFSLSKNVPLDKCDMSALIFRNNFQQQREELAKKLFSLYNEKVFDSSIPSDTIIEWNERMRNTAGTCSCIKIKKRTGVVERRAKIVLSTKVIDSADRLRDTLIHEMCHAATWIVNQVADGHGSFWKSWANHAMKTFPELPPIQRCHNYAINTKYTYKCTKCGYSIGRHTKSLDTERKRCGFCYGTFEVLINKVTKKGEIKSVPSTPKKPNGFALFVKENYAKFKTPDLGHGDVMKALSQKFSDLKVNKT